MRYLGHQELETTFRAMCQNTIPLPLHGPAYKVSRAEFLYDIESLFLTNIIASVT